jgi:farnesyl-diphosphate farnesyltransferase
MGKMVTVLREEDLARLLGETSRTFALAIPLLPEPLARQVGVAYLLFRIADTLEDAPEWDRDRRVTALESFARWLVDPNEDDWRRLVNEIPPTREAGCRDLLERASDVRAAATSMSGVDSETDELVGAAVLRHTRRTALGMLDFVRRQDEEGAITLRDIDDLCAYAYAVAGIVGELLTDLFSLAHEGVARVRVHLDQDAAAFGEGLQLVNILKDAPADLREGRSYLPKNVERQVVVDLARRDLASAVRYVDTLASAKAPRGVILFCDLPARLAIATLDALDDGAPKLAREDVMKIFSDVTTTR